MSWKEWSWNDRRFRAAAIAILAVYAVLESVSGRNDWDIFLAASRALFGGEDIYAITYFDGYHYYYSLLFATVLYPFTWLPALAAKFVWICLNLFFVDRIFRRLWTYFDWTRVSVQGKHWIQVLTFFAAIRFLKSNVHVGQTTILLLFLTLEALQFDEKKQSVRAGLLLSLAINIKLLPAVFLPYFIYRARWKSAIMTAAFVALWWLLPMAWLGPERISGVMQSYVELINPTQERHVLDVEETSFHGLSTLLATLFSAEAHEHNGHGWRRNIADVSPQTLGYILFFVRLFFVLFTLFFLCTKPFQSAPNPIHRSREIAYLFLVIPLIAPHQQHYAFLFALPALAYVTYGLFVHQSNSKQGWWVAWVVVVLCFNLALWLGAFNAFYNHYKILTYGALLLVLLLAFMPPVEKEKVGTSPTFQ